VTIDLTAQAALFQKPFLLHSPSDQNDKLHQSSSGLNWYYYTQQFADAALSLNLNYTNIQKEPLLINYLQLAIDIYSYFEAGGSVAPNGGENLGRKLPIMFAGTVLGYSPMITLMQKTGQYITSDGHSPFTTLPSDYISFPEDAQVFYVAQGDVDVTSGEYHDNNVSCPVGAWCPDGRNPNPPARYTTAMIGMPEWGIRHSTTPKYSDASFTAIYRDIGTGAPVWVGEAMVARAMCITVEWNHPAFFDYVDRFVGVNKGTYTAYTVPDQPTSYSTPGQTELIDAFWDEYRDEVFCGRTASLNGAGSASLNGAGSLTIQ